MAWLIDEIAEQADYDNAVAIASPCSQPALAQAMKRAFADVVPGSLDGTKLYISINAAHRPALEKIVSSSGATVIWLDRAIAIPQRPERIPGSAEEAAATAERSRRRSQEVSDMLEEMDAF